MQPFPTIHFVLAAFSDARRKTTPNDARELQLLETKLDFKLENNGSLFLLRPLSSAAKEWMKEHLPVELPETQFWNDAIVIEARYVTPIVDGIIGDGLVLR